MTLIFDEAQCVCAHGNSMHDDGFGCTVQDCPCLAGWWIEPEESA